jgi:hypothetical protein
MTRALRWVGSKVREPPKFYGKNYLEELSSKFEEEGGEPKKMKAQKEIPHYTKTKDDAELVMERVHEHTTEAYKYNASANISQEGLREDTIYPGTSHGENTTTTNNTRTTHANLE